MLSAQPQIVVPSVVLVGSDDGVDPPGDDMRAELALDQFTTSSGFESFPVAGTTRRRRYPTSSKQRFTWCSESLTCAETLRAISADRLARVAPIRQAVAVTCAPIDRPQIESGSCDLDEVEAVVRSFLAERPTLTADPSGAVESTDAEMESVRLDVAGALNDLDWIEGFRRGLADAERSSKGESLLGPGATADPRDGWSPSNQRVDAYDAGLRRGRGA